MTEDSWDKYWGQEKEHEYWQRPARSVLDLLEKYNRQHGKENLKVLDLGCGIGRHALAFARAGFQVTAVDNSKEALRELESSAQNLDLQIRTVEGNFLERLFPEGSFDLIISYNVIYHGQRGDFKQAISLCKDYLKGEGVLFFTCPTRLDGKYGSGEEVAPATYRSLNSVHPGDIHYFASEEDINEFTAGMQIISIQKDEHYWENEGERLFSSYWEVLARKG